MFRNFKSGGKKQRNPFDREDFLKNDIWETKSVLEKMLDARKTSDFNQNLFSNRSLKDTESYNTEKYSNNDLLRLANLYGECPFDWYRNKITGQIIWLDGHAEIDGYSNLGHTWGKTFTNGDRLLLDGDTKQITYNGEIHYDFSKRNSFPKGNGIAFSDGGNNQDPSSLRTGERNVQWIDFGGAFEALIAMLGFEVNRSTSKGKGTNGGRPTYENKVDDGINAVDNAVNAGKAGFQKTESKENKQSTSKITDSIRTTFYAKDGTEIKSEIRPKRHNE